MPPYYRMYTGHASIGVSYTHREAYTRVIHSLHTQGAYTRVIPLLHTQGGIYPGYTTYVHTGRHIPGLYTTLIHQGGIYRVIHPFHCWARNEALSRATFTRVTVGLVLSLFHLPVSLLG